MTDLKLKISDKFKFFVEVLLSYKILLSSLVNISGSTEKQHGKQSSAYNFAERTLNRVYILFDKHTIKVNRHWVDTK